MDKINNSNKFSVVIFAAGIGRRLGKLGKRQPKSLLKIKNETLLELLIKKLRILGVKKISIIVGYKSNLIIDLLKKKKIMNINIIKIKNFKKNGHSYTWYQYKKYWEKEKKNLLFCHADIHFDIKFLRNIISSKKKNIIGVRKITKNNSNSQNLVVKTYKNLTINKIDFLRNISNPSGEILGINKFSIESTKNLFRFMDSFFRNNNNKSLSWEFFLDKYIHLKLDEFHIIKNQSFNWININKFEDYKKAQTLKV